jgi:hypothetical protein
VSTCADKEEIARETTMDVLNKEAEHEIHDQNKRNSGIDSGIIDQYHQVQHRLHASGDKER